MANTTNSKETKAAKQQKTAALAKKVQAKTSRPSPKKETKPNRQPLLTERTELTADMEEKSASHQEMVAKAAYYISEKKNFQIGLDLDNWLEAEKQILAVRQKKQSLN